MNLPPSQLLFRSAAAALVAAAAAVAQTPVSDTFTYQGQLKSSGAPANGNFDFQFRLYGDNLGSFPIGSVQSALNTPVSQGLFTVPINFGSTAFVGEKRWLEVSVRPVGSATYTTLLPRQEVTPAACALSLALPLVQSGNTNSTLLPGGLINISQAGSASAILGQASGSGAAITGLTTGSGPAVRGVAAGTATAGKFDAAAGGTAVLASNPQGTALRVDGTIAVQGAGVNTHTAAFVQEANALNMDPERAQSTFIMNPLCDGDPNAIILVTHVLPQLGPAAYAGPIRVVYDGGHQRWRITREDELDMVVGARFNVLIIKP